jgi:Family of unknown function (DUF695)
MKPTSVHARFWHWFENNSERLRAAAWRDQQAQETVMRELAEAGGNAAPGLMLEICADRDGKANQLVVSADGKRKLVDDAKDFVDAAPAVTGWNVVAFRPRVENTEITDDLWLRVAESVDGLDLVLYVRGLTAANKDPRGLGASLLAEHAVGERDMLTLVFLRAVEPLPAAPTAQGLRPVRELVDLVDRVKAKRYPPPGQLSRGLDSEWVIVKGTRNGSPLVARLHLGLRALAGHPDYDRRLTVRIPFHEPNAVGFPTKEELHAVCDLEGPLTEVLQEDQQSLPALVITAQGRRELLFHTADAEAALQRLERFRAAGGLSYRLEHEVERDTFWALFRSLCDKE